MAAGDKDVRAVVCRTMPRRRSCGSVRIRSSIGHRFLRFFFRRNWSWMKAAASTANSGRG
jgi:hypothetical protein